MKININRLLDENTLDFDQLKSMEHLLVFHRSHGQLIKGRTCLNFLKDFFHDEKEREGKNFWMHKLAPFEQDFFDDEENRIQESIREVLVVYALAVEGIKFTSIAQVDKFVNRNYIGEQAELAKMRARVLRRENIQFLYSIWSKGQKKSI